MYKYYCHLLIFNNNNNLYWTIFIGIFKRGRETTHIYRPPLYKGQFQTYLIFSVLLYLYIYM